MTFHTFTFSCSFSGVVPANDCLPFFLANRIILHQPNPLHIMFHCIHKPLSWSFSFFGGSISIILLPTYFLSLLETCLNHLNLALLTLSLISPTCAVPPVYSFFLLSVLVIIIEKSSISNSETSRSTFYL